MHIIIVCNESIERKTKNQIDSIQNNVQIMNFNTTGFHRKMLQTYIYLFIY